MDEKSTNASNNWDDIKYRLKTKWSKINEDHINKLQKDLTPLAKILRETYGYSAAFADKESDIFIETLNKAKSEMVKEHTQLKEDYPNIDEMKNDKNDIEISPGGHY